MMLFNILFNDYTLCCTSENLSASGVWSIIISSIIFILSINSFLIKFIPSQSRLQFNQNFFISCKSDFCHFYLFLIILHFSKVGDNSPSSVYNTQNNWIESYSTYYCSNNHQTNSRDCNCFIKTFESFVRFFETPVFLALMFVKIFESFDVWFWQRFIHMIEFKDVFHLYNNLYI